MAKLEPLSTDNYRAKREKWFLTYPRTPARFTPKVFLKQIPLILDLNKRIVGLKKYVISQEKHELEGEHQFHLHAYLEFSGVIETTNSRFWDVKYYNQNYHPNDGGGIRNVHRTIAYVLKDPIDSITNMEESEILPPLLYAAKTKKSDREFYREVFWQTSMKPGSHAAMKAIENIRLLDRYDCDYIDDVWAARHATRARQKLEAMAGEMETSKFPQRWQVNDG